MPIELASAKGEGGEGASPPPPPPQDPPPQDPPPPQQRNIRVDPPPPQQRNIRVSEGNVNDQHQDFHRQLALVHEEKAEEHKRRSQRACQHRLLLQRLVLLLLLCFVLGVLSQHYFPMDVSTDIFPTRSFQVDVSGVHAGVWGVLREKFASSKLMGCHFVFSVRILAAQTFHALRAERHTAETTYQCQSESAEFNLCLRYDMRISVIIFSPTENGPRRLRLTLVCSFSSIILDFDSIKTLGRE